MNDLERALRDELRAWAEAGDREVSLVAGIERRVRRVRRRLAAALAAAAGLATAAAGIGAVLVMPGPHPAVRSASHGAAGRPAFAGLGADNTIAGQLTLRRPYWAPVAYLGAQVSVPPGWLLEAGGTTACGGGAGGMVFLARPPRARALAAAGCRLAANVVTLTPYPAGLSLSHPSGGPRGRVNGIPVGIRRVPGTSRYVYSAPGLGVQVAAQGPLARQVLATLTRSPRSVALAVGKPAPVPAGWRWHRFGGIEFAAPAAWATERDTAWGGCPYGIAAGQVRLSTAATFSAPGCPGPLPTAGFHAARPGVVVGAGRYSAGAAADVGRVPCTPLHGLRACVLRPAPDAVLLVVVAFPPGRGLPTVVEIGLAGSGTTARAILDSIRPAR